MAWIDDRDYPGGPYNFLMEQQSRPILTVGNTASILGSFLADGILVRLLASAYLEKTVKATLGAEYAKPYGMIASLVVEAALPFTILSIVLLALFGGSNTAQNLFVPLLVQVECFTPSLIILRVIVRGSQDSYKTDAIQASRIQFAAPPQVGTESTLTNAELEKQGRVVTDHHDTSSE
ncbi:hypothetical protein H0H93_008380 [Arthromyces matolae]|nr:hypothetical protein H0H93_008380 [Arthromyces matolae]